MVAMHQVILLTPLQSQEGVNATLRCLCGVAGCGQWTPWEQGQGQQIQQAL